MAFEHQLDQIRALIQVAESDFETMRRHAAFFEKYAPKLLDFIMEVLVGHPETEKTLAEAGVPS